MATKKLSAGTWRDRDGVRRSHKRGAAPVQRISAWKRLFSVATYFDTLSEEAREKALMRHGWYRSKMGATT